MSQLESLLQAFYAFTPDVNMPAQGVAFGTSGHRGSSLKSSFNEQHILAIVQSVADWRTQEGIMGPLFLGKDTHALSQPAWDVALKVLVANGVEVCIAKDDLVTATPLVSRAILAFNASSPQRQADGLIITPSHNPPEDGGIKYNSTDGGPADTAVTAWIEKRANQYLTNGCLNVAQVSLAQAKVRAKTYDYVGNYVAALSQVVNLAAIKHSTLKLAADPMGGTALPVWQALREAGLAIEIVNEKIDPTFAFMPPDHDGRIRMDCSSTAAMKNLLAMRERFDLAFGNDPDADRHGIVDAQGLMNPNHYLCVAVDYLLKHRANWASVAKVGKTLVTSSLMDKVVAANARALYEVPVGFKWFVTGLHQGSLVFGGEESAGASFLTFDGQPWSTDKDGIILCLLAAEIMAVTGISPSEYYHRLTQQLGAPYYQRVDTPCSAEQKAAFKKLTAEMVNASELAGAKVTAIFTQAPGNGASIGGLKVSTEQGWFAARPSGTEDIYKIYAESFHSSAHLTQLIAEAKALLDRVL